MIPFISILDPPTKPRGEPEFQPFGFAGGLYDADLKRVRFGARDYDSKQARWTSKDPMWLTDGSSNAYEYALGSPINIIDPSGLSGITIGIQTDIHFGIFSSWNDGLYIGSEGIYLFHSTGSGTSRGAYVGIRAFLGFVGNLNNFWDEKKEQAYNALSSGFCKSDNVGVTIYDGIGYGVEQAALSTYTSQVAGFHPQDGAFHW